MPPLDRDSCTRALEARDARFDGVFFVGITSTGIYCRPICPARATLRKNRRFFSTAAAAERSGFRPCLRCRPELAPGSARVDAVPRLAESAAARIAAGALNGRSVDDLAAELGVGGRQLRRAMQQELGVSPIELAQTHRLLLAKRLLTDTRLSISTVAYASGFQSLRRFNALFSTRYRMKPDALRRRRTRQVVAEPNESVTLTLSYRPPIDWDALLAFLAARATPGVEVVADGSYTRTVRVGDRVGSVRVRRSEPRTARDDALPVIHLDVSAALVPSLMHVCAGVRQLFDLDAEPTKIESHLAASGFAPLRDLRHGLRVPGAFDGFELAIRAILGQQVSVKGATTLMARLTAEFGEVADVGDPSLTRTAVTADRLADARVVEHSRDRPHRGARGDGSRARATRCDRRPAPRARRRRSRGHANSFSMFRASDRGRRSTSPCAHSIGPMRFLPAISCFVAAPGISPRRDCSKPRMRGGPGARTPPCSCG